MGGSNPYIEEVKYKKAAQKFKVTFLPSGKTVEVDPEKFPYGHNGLPGSILDISEGFKMGLDHACGGVCLFDMPCRCEGRTGILQRSHRCGTRRARRSAGHHAKVAPGLPDRAGRHHGHRGGSPRLEQKLRQRTGPLKQFSVVSSQSSVRREKRSRRAEAHRMMLSKTPTWF